MIIIVETKLAQFNLINDMKRQESLRPKNTLGAIIGFSKIHRPILKAGFAPAFFQKLRLHRPTLLFVFFLGFALVVHEAQLQQLHRQCKTHWHVDVGLRNMATEAFDAESNSNRD